MNDLTLEIFRQDLKDYLKEHRKVLDEMPHGIFSGFGLLEFGSLDYEYEGLVALVRSKIDERLYLVYAPKNDSVRAQIELNEVQVFGLLRKYKDSVRSVPKAIDGGDMKVLNECKEMLRKELECMVSRSDDEYLNDSVKGRGRSGQLNMDTYWQEQNFDLIVWEVISKA
jgi:hypothetical protein